MSKRSREVKASERSGVESVIEAKLRVSGESSTEFSAGEVSSGFRRRLFPFENFQRLERS